MIELSGGDETNAPYDSEKVHDSAMRQDGAAQDGAAEDLQTRLRGGDREALATLFAENHDRLVRLVGFRLSRRLFGRVGTDDVLQEAYLSAAQRLNHFATEIVASPYIWLRMIVMQTLTDIHRHHLGVQMRDADREILRGVSSASIAAILVEQLTSPSQVVERAEMFELIQKTVASLEPLDQEVLALRHFEELGNNEVAEALGIQPKAASIRYVRAVKRLREALSHVPGFFEL